jgi:hypothetical protein
MSTAVGAGDLNAAGCAEVSDAFDGEIKAVLE